MQLHDALYSQGFGTRRVCWGLVQQGCVEILSAESVWVVCVDPTQVVDFQQSQFRIQGTPWKFYERAYVLLHKPEGTECSQKPSAYPSVYTLLPAPLRQRPSKGGLLGVQAVGRLDQDTTGMLLLSDDGQFIHRMSSPKKHIPKVYAVTTKHPIDELQVKRLLDGVVLDDDPKPVRAAACVPQGSHILDLVLTEGKYHQVKRMLAAVGNRVVRLHRAQIGGLSLPEQLAPGQWMWLDDAMLTQVTQSGIALPS